MTEQTGQPSPVSMLNRPELPFQQQPGQAPMAQSLPAQSFMQPIAAPAAQFNQGPTWDQVQQQVQSPIQAPAPPPPVAAPAPTPAAPPPNDLNEIMRRTHIAQSAPNMVQGLSTPEQFSAPYSPSNYKNWMALQNAEANALADRYGR